MHSSTGLFWINNVVGIFVRNIELRRIVTLLCTKYIYIVRVFINSYWILSMYLINKRDKRQRLLNFDFCWTGPVYISHHRLIKWSAFSHKANLLYLMADPDVSGNIRTATGQQALWKISELGPPPPTPTHLPGSACHITRLWLDNLTWLQ